MRIKWNEREGCGREDLETMFYSSSEDAFSLCDFARNNTFCFPQTLEQGVRPFYSAGFMTENNLFLNICKPCLTKIHETIFYGQIL